jgi:4-amino-4-deoxy-L-arabinose transferase-like glycosyltransferase
VVTRLISETEKTRWVVALMAVWVLLGLIGHDPWRPDEAHTFGIAWRALSSSQWLIPNLAGERFEDLPPLTYWSAAAFAWVFQSILPLHDGARLSSGVWIGLSFWLVGMTARELYGKGHGRYAILTLAGCIGLFERAHQLLVDNTLFAGLALTLYALTRMQRTRDKSALLLALGVAISFFSKGWAGLWLASLMVAGVWWAMRKKQAIYAPRTLFCAAGIVLFSIAAWAFLVERAAPGALAEWTGSEWADVFKDRAALEPAQTIWFMLKTLIWFAFPALPLAIWSMRLMQRGFIGGLKQWQFRVPAFACGAMVIGLLIAGQPRTVALMPLLIPLALIAVPGLDHLKRGHSGFLDWMGIFFFGALMIAAWVFWSTLYLGAPRGIFLKLLSNFQPGFSEPIKPLATILAAALTALWFAMIRPARRTHKRALVNWTVGITSVWGVGMLLFTPYLDYGKSYRIPIAQTLSQLPESVRTGQQCLASSGLGLGQRAMLDYFAKISSQRVENTKIAQCNWLLVQANADNPAKFNLPVAKYERAGVMMRPGGKEEPWHLYKRIAP